MFDAFEASKVSTWEKAAAEELQGADPWKKLHREHQGIPILPIYTSGESTNSQFQLSPAAPGTFRGPRTWYNCPRVTVNDPVEANGIALDHLEQGADGIFFVLGEAADMKRLLKNIEWPFCSLNFLATANEEDHQRQILDCLADQKDPVTGAWYGFKAGAIPPSHSSFRFCGHVIPSTAQWDDIAGALVGAYQQLGSTFAARANEVAFQVEVGADFFVEASRMRAIRSTWNKLLAHAGAPPSPLYLHAVSAAWTSEAYQPHANMLKATTAAMSAILGGCDALTIDAEDSQQPMMNRVARNVGIILREESHFSKVADPLAGAYYTEDLTRRITDRIWNQVTASIPL